MFFRVRRKPPPAHPAALEASLAYTRVREHWGSCNACREAAAASASMWCEEGLQLMKRGVVEHPHWDTCTLCREAQERVQSSQCSLGRNLESEYRVLVRRLAEA